MRFPDREEQNDIILATLGRFMFGEWGQMVENLRCLYQTGTVISDPGVRIREGSLNSPYREERLQAIVDAEREADVAEAVQEAEDLGLSSIMPYIDGIAQTIRPAYASGTPDFNSELGRKISTVLTKGGSLDRNDPLVRAFLLGGLIDSDKLKELREDRVETGAYLRDQAGPAA